MIAMGLNVGKATLRWVTVTGTLADPDLVARGWVDLDPEAAQPAAMAALDDAFRNVLDANPADMMAYRMHMGRAMTQAQVATFHYPWGVVNLACGRRNIRTVEFTGTSLTAKRFGLPKGEKPMVVVDAILGAHPPHWDDAQRYAACVAWGALA